MCRQHEHLKVLVNSFVAEKDPIQIGRLRYTETETLGTGELVPVSISPNDFLCNRTALFGKTRMGKSNTIKVILDTMLKKEENLGQIVFDLSGEYTYPDPQTGGSLYLSHREKCVRYSLNPRTPDLESKMGISAPSMLRINFYEQIALGHSIISALFNTRHQRRPDYMSAFFAWEPIDEEAASEIFPDQRGPHPLSTRTLHVQSVPVQGRIRRQWQPPSSPTSQFSDQATSIL